ncbi:MAG: hypothetical protein RLY71_4360 [Pseudomonadota bacterium]|jgi:predicted secreted hydrolase
MAADPHDPAAPGPSVAPEHETDPPWPRRTWLRRVIGGTVELALNPFGRVLAASRAAAPLAGPAAEGAASAAGAAARTTAGTAAQATAAGTAAGATASHTGPAAGAELTRRVLRFPADHGAHPAQRTEWWYVTGWLAAGPAPDAASSAAGAAAAPTPRWGFQITFFRSRTDVAADHPSAFAARQLIMAHAALTELPAPGDPTAAAGRLRHDQRIARAGFGLAGAAEGDLDVTLHGWSLRRGPDTAATSAQHPAIDPTPLHARLATDAGFALDLTLQPTQPRLLQGEAGWSRKGPDPAQVSLYVSEPQLRVGGRLVLDRPAGGAPDRGAEVHGRAWLDHEWSESVLAPEAVGWDWIGINLLDGSALTAFRLRRADGSALWAGGSWRSTGSSMPRIFTPDEVTFTPLRAWRSPATGTRYPVEWQVTTPAGAWRVRALLDAQELDSRASTGTIYWEGLSELLDAGGRRVGLGYLELTGYAGTLKL